MQQIFIKEINSIEELKIFNRIYQNFALTVKNWIPIPYELFLGMYNNFKQNAKFLIAFKEEENIRIPVSAGLFLLFNRKIIYLANGTDNKYRNYHANSLLIWHMMQWGNVNEYEELDIYGVYPNPENYFEKGLNFFKSQFGGELIEKFMYTNRAISPFKIFLFKKVISPIALPIYKRFTRTK